MIAVVLALLGADGGVLVGSGGLSKDEIAAVIRKHSGEVRYCYERELQKLPKLEGKLTVTFFISPTGDVTLADPEPADLPPGMISCVRGRVVKMKFPPPKGGGSVTVTYPWVFKAE